jgi:Domain of unknown function (DUF4160)
MPEISRFYGIIIRMFAEAGLSHHSPHFHAYYQDDEVVIRLIDAEILAGSMPRKQLRLIQAWAELHQTELQNDWDLLQSGQPAISVKPLE